MVKNLESNNPLQNLILLKKDARGYGFDWPDHEMILEQAIAECREIKEAIRTTGKSTRRNRGFAPYGNFVVYFFRV